MRGRRCNRMSGGRMKGQGDGRVAVSVRTAEVRRRLVRITNRRFLYGSSNRQITRAMTLRMKEGEVGVGSLSLRGVSCLSNALNAKRFLRRGKAQLSGRATAGAFRKALRRPSHEVPSRLFDFPKPTGASSRFPAVVGRNVKVMICFLCVQITGVVRGVSLVLSMPVR